MLPAEPAGEGHFLPAAVFQRLLVRDSALTDVDGICTISYLGPPLCRVGLFYPLASLDVSGQQHLFDQEPHLTRTVLVI